MGQQCELQLLTWIWALIPSCSDLCGQWHLEWHAATVLTWVFTHTQTRKRCIAFYYSILAISSSAKASKICICPWLCLSAIRPPHTALNRDCVCLYVQQSFVATLELQSVVSGRDEVSSTNQRCPSAVFPLSFWLARRPDFVKVMVPGVARSHAVSVSLIIYVQLMTRRNREAIPQMKNATRASNNSIGRLFLWVKIQNVNVVSDFLKRGL